MQQIAVIDIIFAVLIFILVIRCAMKGLIGEVISMAAVVLGFMTALLLCSNGGIYLREKFMPDMRILSEILAFIALFLIVFLFIKIVGSILKGIIEGIHLGGVDHFLGIAFGLLEGLVVVGLILFVFSIQPLFDSQKILEQSIFARLLLPLIRGEAIERTVDGPALNVLLFVVKNYV
ncbi:MAG: CvpA family protein [Treponema sp.]|jgi:membrane protein required for colicin V production|nr:CvpA family protein [Treponema sp.]